MNVDTENGVDIAPRSVQGKPADCLDGVRPKDGVNSVWASMRNVGTCGP